jgi:hypothetical protein
MSVLITAASHAQAYKLDRLLQLDDVIFGDHQQLPQLAYPGKKFIKIPASSSPSYAHEMLDLALNSGMTKIFPLYAGEILPLSEARQLFDEYGISILVPSVLWVKKHSDNIQQSQAGDLVVLDGGQVMAGKLPAHVLLPEENLSGIFQIQEGHQGPVFKLFTV